MHKRGALFVGFIGVLGIMLGACESNTSNFLVTTPSGAIDVTTTNGFVTSITFVSTDPFDPLVATVSAEQAASAVAAAAGNYFRPASCVQASASGNTVTFNLNNCIGPFGGSSISGTITSTYVAQSSGYQVTIKSNNLTLDAGTINLDVVANYSMTGNARTVTVTNNTSARGPQGNTVAQSQMSTLNWNKGDTCATVNSTGSLQINSTSMNQAFNNNLLCVARCPTGTATFTNSQNQTLTLTFNGTATVAVADSSGKTGTAQLICGQ
jgi:hypothetical protein